MKTGKVLCILSILLLVLAFGVIPAMSQDKGPGNGLKVAEGATPFAGPLAEHVTVSFTDLYLPYNPITTVKAGTPFLVWGYWSTAMDNPKGIYIGLMPNSNSTSIGSEVVLKIRATTNEPGIIGMATTVVASPWTTPGTVPFIVKIDNRGTGFKSINVTR
jgi:hypothetical protein